MLTGRDLLAKVEDSAACQTGKRGLLIYEEVPKSRVGWFDFWAPLILAVCVLILSCVLHVLAQSNVAGLGFATLILEFMATVGMGYAGWLVSRAIFGRQITPMGRTGFRQSKWLIVILVVLVVALASVPLLGSGPEQDLWAAGAGWVIDPIGQAAEHAGWAWWSLLGLIFGFFGGMTVWRTEEQRRRFAHDRPRLYSAALLLRLDDLARGARKVANLLAWRVDLKDFTCDCAPHAAPVSTSP